MRKIENSGTIGDAVAQSADPIDMLLVVGTGRADEFRIPSDDPADRRRGAASYRAIAVTHTGPHFEYVANAVAEFGALCDELIEDCRHFALHAVDALLDQQPAIDDHPAGIRHACRGIPALLFGLTAVDRVDIESGVARA